MELEDALILDSNEDGTEKLRLRCRIDSHYIDFRFPGYSSLDKFIDNVYTLFIRLAYSANDIGIDNFGETDKFQEWAILASNALKLKKVSKLVEHIFFRYLKPELPHIWNLPILNKWYCRRHLRIDATLQMFIAIMHVDDWIKKKMTFELQTMFQRVTAQPSMQKLQKKQDGQSTKSTTDRRFRSGLSFDD